MIIEQIEIEKLINNFDYHSVLIEEAENSNNEAVVTRIAYLLYKSGNYSACDRYF